MERANVDGADNTPTEGIMRIIANSNIPRPTSDLSVARDRAEDGASIATDVQTLEVSKALLCQSKISVSGTPPEHDHLTI